MERHYPESTLSKSERSREQAPLPRQWFETTKEVLRKLTLWGFISAATLEGTAWAQEKGSNREGDNALDSEAATLFSAAQQLEEEFEQGAEGTRVESEKPVIVVVAKKALEKLEHGTAYPVKRIEHFASDILMTRITQQCGDKFDVINRSASFMGFLKGEAALRRQGMLDPETAVIHKYRKPNYYIVVSEDFDGENTSLSAEIIDMNKGTVSGLVLGGRISQNTSRDNQEVVNGLTKDVIDQLEKI